ncbi:hypothetical protein HBI44_076250 [Parastagonospora nodorum]|nr:hypothetical protein HBI44_076250 [Parastagonospora nodorum]
MIQYLRVRDNVCVLAFAFCAAIKNLVAKAAAEACSQYCLCDINNGKIFPFGIVVARLSRLFWNLFSSSSFDTSSSNPDFVLGSAHSPPAV